MKRTIFHILVVISVSGIMAGALNYMRHDKIPWVQEWDHYVESRARDEGVDVITLPVAHTYYQEESHLFVDARSVEEFEGGHIPGALSLPFEELEEHFDALEQVLLSEKPVVVYCSNRECDDALYLAMG